MPIRATITAVDVAETCTPPVASTVESTIDAVAVAGCEPPNADEISGSPSNASSAANKRLVRPQPTVLNASSIATDCEPDAMAAAVRAVMLESLTAVTVTSPVAVSGLVSTVARAELSTRLVAITPPAASD